MQKEIIETADGSKSIIIPEINESYHSVNGALTESKHIFIDAALKFSGQKELCIFEVGLGTGLNAILSCEEAFNKGLKITYHSIEKYPLNNEMLKKLNYKEIIETKNATLCKQINEAEWNKKTIIKADTETKGEFSLLKIQEDFITFNTTKLFDIIYFDAFAPDKQPQLWTKEIFEKISSMTKKDGILTTYSAKGEVRRKLINSGFEVERLPGPPGKRQIIRAIKK